MSNEILGKFLLKLYEKTGDNEIGYYDRYEIGEEIGLLDKVQTDHVVENLVKDGFVINDAQSIKIKLDEDVKASTLRKKIAVIRLRNF